MSMKSLSLTAAFGMLLATLMVTGPEASLANSKDKLTPPDATWTSPSKEEFETQPMKHDRLVEKTAADKQLEEQVSMALDSYKDVNVSAEQGVVTLTGAVASEQEKDAAISRAGGVKGVQSVNSDLKIIK